MRLELLKSFIRDFELSDEARSSLDEILEVLEDEIQRGVQPTEESSAPVLERPIELRETRPLGERGDVGQTTRALRQESRSANPVLDRLRIAENERYEDRGVIGVGGMSEVRRVWDRRLGRTVARKIINESLLRRSTFVTRFLEEAQIGAQLQHPGIVPVYDVGILPNGRLYFTMKEVRGQTLSSAILELHQASVGAWGTSFSGRTFRGLMDVFRRVCDAMAYAHRRGIVHRDLKPSNVMIGSNGEALVVDWGLARVIGTPDRSSNEQEEEPIVTERTRLEMDLTRAGTVIGTPAYLPPERAQGTSDGCDPRADVYALGAILYFLLSGKAPYEASTDENMFEKVVNERPPPLQQATELPLPEEIVNICGTAMRRDPGRRYANARFMVAGVEAWLDGVERREQAQRLVERAVGLHAGSVGRRREAEVVEKRAKDLLREVAPNESEDVKAAAWALEDEARDLRRRAAVETIEAELALQASLTHDPELSIAHETLAERYQAAHREAEAVQDADGALRAETFLRAHVSALPEGGEARTRLARYLEGKGALSLITEPSGARVTLYRYETRRRRLVEALVGDLGTTPLEAIELLRGSYLLVIEHDETAPVRYPVLIDREGNWDCVPPGEAEPTAVRLPRPGELSAEEVYVPPGPFWAGGDALARDNWPRRRMWLDGYIIDRYPVTNEEYIAFLDAFVHQGREDEALRFVPRERGNVGDEQGSMTYGRDEKGHFQLLVDIDGDEWLPDWPVLLVDWYGASAYAEWKSSCTGLPYRLPTEVEWEKAARGVDGRFFPWGNYLDPSWCSMRASRSDRPLPQVITDYPVDESPWGVRGMAGNARDWCTDLFRQELRDEPSSVLSEGDSSSEHRSFRGGSWATPLDGCRAAARGHDFPTIRDSYQGFRLVRPWP